jgi:hypothetical protein
MITSPAPPPQRGLFVTHRRAAFTRTGVGIMGIHRNRRPATIKLHMPAWGQL